MSKLNQEELLKELKEVFDHYLEDLRDYPSEVIVKQAYQQIKEMIQKPKIWIRPQFSKRTEITEEWIQSAIDYIAEYPSYKRLEEKLKEIGVEIEQRKS